MPGKKGKSNIGNNIREIKKKHPEMKRDQVLAIALSEAGQSKPKPKKKRGK